MLMINILDGSVGTMKKNEESLVVASRYSALEVNADKTKYMLMSRDQNAGRSYSMKTDHSSFEKVQVHIFGNNLNKSKLYSGRN